MKTISTYRRITAILLAALVFQVVALKEVHHLVEHEHEMVAHCTDSGNQTHLHSEEYHPENCFICDFHFAPATLEFQEIAVYLPSIPDFRDSFNYQKPFSQRVNWHFQLRGPPALAT